MVAGNFCNCKDCKQMKRRGKVLGSRNMGYHLKNFGGKIEYYFGPVSAYVPFAPFAKGRRPLRRLKEVMLDYRD